MVTGVSDGVDDNNLVNLQYPCTTGRCNDVLAPLFVIMRSIVRGSFRIVHIIKCVHRVLFYDRLPPSQKEYFQNVDF